MTKQPVEVETMGLFERFWADEQGSEVIEVVAVLGFVVLPLLAVLLHFKGQMIKMFVDAWVELAQG